MSIINNMVLGIRRRSWMRADARALLEREPQRNEPLDDDRRVYNYVRQGGVGRPLTPRQQRRRRHKNNAMKVVR
jgi:hypothetical protein